MRVFLGCRNKGSIKKDQRLSKFNYSSRQFYSIDKAILEKRLLCDISRYNKQPTVHVITDLEACYDRQLYNIRSIVEESVGIDQERMKLTIKVLPQIKHYMCTGYGISLNSCGSEKQQIGRTGQGNHFSGNMSRDTSCFVIREVEVRRLGAIVELG